VRTSFPKEKNQALRYLVRLLTTVVLLVFLGAAGLWLVYWTIPMRNTQRSSFDTIIVLGCPANPDGTPSRDERQRVEAGIREFRAGVAPRLLMTGGAAHNRYVEARVMAQLAEQEGVPAADVFEERQAHDTIQNAFYSARIMEEHGWHAAEVVSEPSHLRRASLIFSHFPVQWRMHASQWPSVDSEGWILHRYFREMVNTDKLRVFGFPKSRFLPESRGR
jgi:uncharacterized SAM-binding protein YcdF (DUF218 family)